MSHTELPAASTVADAAKLILDGIKGDREFDAFKAASLEYSEDWQCFTGFPVVQRWNLEADAPALFEEGLRALALKAAVYELTADRPEPRPQRPGGRPQPLPGVRGRGR
ncbi:hypothetical protein [Streptomyces bobili]|uniref:hypothetical protein n=1 Tax=Streptomyces bobili TaxID=67280 RepID=UPI0037168FD6